jgi:hypothetical protein
MSAPELEAAPMRDDGKCSVCGDWARDCDCHLCPDCEEGIRADELECSSCGYECDTEI